MLISEGTRLPGKPMRPTTMTRRTRLDIATPHSDARETSAIRRLHAQLFGADSVIPILPSSSHRFWLGLAFGYNPLEMLMQSLAVAILAAAAPAVARPDVSFWKRPMSLVNETRSCGIYDNAPTVKAPKVNPWAQISPADVTAVWNLLHAPETGLNLTAPSKATVTDNYVYFLDTLRKFIRTTVPTTVISLSRARLTDL